MSCFEGAFDELIGLEGGYVNDPADPGGETKWGISKRAFPQLSIASLTREDAKQVYWKYYWNPMLLSQLEECSVAEELFEQAVNMGRRQASLNAQEACQLLGEKQVHADGMIGPITISALNSLADRWPDALLKTLNGLQFQHYRWLAQNSPELSKFFRGWLRRVG